MDHASHAAPATRPALEVADILRERGDAYRETHRLSAQQQRVMDALVNCRTAALGGFKAHCGHCGAVTVQYASCRNRHCPKCQTLSQIRWVERQCANLLDNPVGGNAFIPPPPACTFFLRIFVWHVPPFRGCGPGEGRPADLWHLWPAGHPRGQAV